MSSKTPVKKPVPAATAAGGKRAGATTTAAPAVSGISANKPIEAEDLSGIPTVLKYGILGLISLLAFSIRLFAVVRYESVIHEFDPYFNFRTTKFLAHEGFLAFLNWFDDRGWYPLGRTIGGTIYPGLMLTAAALYWALNYLFITINIRNVCVFLAPLFSALAAISSYLLTTEVTKRSAAGLLAGAFTAIVPSYISRSVGGSYDNEGVAIFALIFCFYLWIKAVHTGSIFWSCACALSYYYMVAAWGGYVFIINIIPIYVVVMCVGGRYSHRLYVAYSVFYTLGSLMAMTVPFVGFNVINQAECAASHGVFIALNVYMCVHYLYSNVDEKLLRGLFTTLALVLVGGVAFGLIALQLLGKLTWTGRSLTLLDPTYASKYIPIIASVSEHQPTTWTSFFFDLHILVPLAPVGLYTLFSNISDGGIFVILYGTLAWYFAGVMVRLMLTLAPIACVLSAIGFSSILNRICVYINSSGIFTPLVSAISPPVAASATAAAAAAAAAAPAASTGSQKKSSSPAAPLSPALSVLLLIGALSLLFMFSSHSTYVSSMAYSSPSIVIDAGRTADGRRVMYDDYREAYFWLRQNTPVNSKILSWWDYGYQMSAMANRTVLVDNNTWNNTHIATVGRVLASTEEEAYPILESLDVDYVLVIFGGLTGYSSDDINKFLWPVRIGSGVFPNDMPSEKDFYTPNGGFDIGPGGAPALLNCVAYKLCYYRFGQMQTEYGKPPGYDRARGREVGRKNIELTTMEEAFTSEHWIVRIFKVKKRPEFDAFKSASSKGSASAKPKAKADKKAKAAADSGEDKDGGDEARYVGCVGGESMFGADKVYEGGGVGANYNLALHHAKTQKKRYFAIARGGADGHSFAFNQLVTDKGPGMMQGGGCERACLDQESKVCGCIDSACTGPIPRGEEHNRRWAVYEVLRK